MPENHRATYDRLRRRLRTPTCEATWEEILSAEREDEVEPANRLPELQTWERFNEELNHRFPAWGFKRLEGEAFGRARLSDDTDSATVRQALTYLRYSAFTLPWFRSVDRYREGGWWPRFLTTTPALLLPVALAEHLCLWMANRGMLKPVAMTVRHLIDCLASRF